MVVWLLATRAVQSTCDHKDWHQAARSVYRDVLTVVCSATLRWLGWLAPFLKILEDSVSVISVVEDILNRFLGCTCECWVNISKRNNREERARTCHYEHNAFEWDPITGFDPTNTDSVCDDTADAWTFACKAASGRSNVWPVWVIASIPFDGLEKNCPFFQWIEEDQRVDAAGAPEKPDADNWLGQLQLRQYIRWGGKAGDVTRGMMLDAINRALPRGVELVYQGALHRQCANCGKWVVFQQPCMKGGACEIEARLERAFVREVYLICGGKLATCVPVKVGRCHYCKPFAEKHQPVYPAELKACPLCGRPPKPHAPTFEAWMHKDLSLAAWKRACAEARERPDAVEHAEPQPPQSVEPDPKPKPESEPPVTSPTWSKPEPDISTSAQSLDLRTFAASLPPGLKEVVILVADDPAKFGWLLDSPPQATAKQWNKLQTKLLPQAATFSWMKSFQNEWLGQTGQGLRDLLADVQTLQCAVKSPDQDSLEEAFWRVKVTDHCVQGVAELFLADVGSWWPLVLKGGCMDWEALARDLTDLKQLNATPTQLEMAWRTWQPQFRQAITRLVRNLKSPLQ